MPDRASPRSGTSTEANTPCPMCGAVPEAVQRLWEAATYHWSGDPWEMFDSSTALPGESIRGKELFRIGVTLGFIEKEDEDA